MRTTEQQGYIGMTGQREVAKNKPHFSLVIALTLTQRLGKRAAGGQRESSNSSVLWPVCGSAHVHTLHVALFLRLLVQNGAQLWLVQGDHGSQSNDFEK